MEHCLSQPPRESQIHHSICKNLTSTSIIRTSHDRGAQVVVVNRDMVAKIYDPLYHPAFDEYGGQQDVVVEADGDYSREAAAFELLQKSPEERITIPAYCGTWTIDVEVSSRRDCSEIAQQPQSARLILMKCLHVDCMIDLDAE
jgi:hypothetical protein